MRKFKKLIAILSALVLLCTTFAGTGIFASAAETELSAFQSLMAKKAVLKPGNMDDLSTDDYVYTMVRSRTLPDVSRPEADHLAKRTAPVYNDRGTWYEVMKYLMGGILGLRNEHIITHAGSGIAWGGHAVVYNVVENSYVATSVILHPDYAAKLELATMFKDYFGYEVSSDGKLWTAVTPNITNVTGWSTNNQVAYAQATVKIPEGMKYYRITLPPYSKTAMGNTLRVDNGYAIPNIDMLVESTVGLSCAGVGPSVASNYNLANYSKYEDIPGDYSVTLPEGVTANKTASLKKGDVVKLTVDKSKYFAVSSLKYSYKYAEKTITKTIFAKGDTDVVGEGSGNVFKFVMPDSSVDVSIKFMENTESTLQDNMGIVATSVNKQKRAQRYMTRVYLEDGKIRVGENLYRPKGFGMVFLPEYLLPEGNELTRETASAMDIPVDCLYDKTEKYIDFVCGVKGMSEALQQKKLIARAYVIYQVGSKLEIEYIDSPSTVSYKDINGSTTVPYFEITSLSECNFLNDNENTLMPKIEWSVLAGAKSYNLKIEKVNVDNTTSTVLTVNDIKETNYTPATKLEANQSYLCTVFADFAGKTYYANDKKNGYLFLADYNAATHPSNKGLNFSFSKGTLPTEQVLRNYLSRSMSCHMLDDYVDRDMVNFEENLRMILNTGVKYVQRAVANDLYVVSKANDVLIERNSKLIEKVHEIDPEIIFEGCVFETANANMADYKIPQYVFDAFGLSYEDRSFDYTKMAYSDGHNNLGSYIHPDMSKTETQMWWYYRATWLIDQGYEALHLGSTPCMSDVDAGNGYVGWNKVCTLIREYAKTHARRGYVFLNGHVIDMRYRKNFLSSYNHVLDFNMWMTCAEVPAGETEGAPTEENPQELEIKKGVTNAIYGKTQSAKHPLGFTTKAIFLVELDNYGINYDNYNKPTSNGGTYPWGIDEIGWFNQQPDWYRQQWVEYAYNRVREIDSYGYFCMPGIRAAALINSPVMYYYRANSKLSRYGDKVKGDEFAIRSIWSGEKTIDFPVDPSKNNDVDANENW